MSFLYFLIAVGLLGLAAVSGLAAIVFFRVAAHLLRGELYETTHQKMWFVGGSYDGDKVTYKGRGRSFEAYRESTPDRC